MTLTRKINPRVNIVRIFSDGDFVFGHWDTVEHVAPVSEWKNQNGKF